MAVIKKTPSQDYHAEIQACLRKGDYKGAIAAFEALLKGSSGQGQMRMRYADTLVLAGRRNDAIREYSRVAEEMAEGGFLVQAVAIYKKIVKLDPRQTDVVQKLARLDAERSQAKAPAASSQSGTIHIDETVDELDIGMDLGMGAAPAAPAAPATRPAGAPASPVAAPASAAPVRPAPTTGPAPGPTRTAAAAPAAAASSPRPVAAAAPAAARVTSPATPASPLKAAVEPSLDLVGDVSLDDIAPDLSPDLAPGGEEGIDLAAEDLVPSDFAAPIGKAHGAASPAPAAAAPAAAAASSGFDFGLATPAAAPTVAPSAPSSAASAASSFDFGFATPAEKAPAAPAPPPPASGGFDFGGAVETPTTTVEMPPPSAAMIAAGAPGDFALDFDAQGPAADAGLAASPFGGPDDGENLLGLGSDDIDAMLDGIIRDVGSDDAGGASQLEAADTNIPLFSHLAVDEYVEILKLLEWKIVKQGDVVVKEGDPGHSLFIISTGLVEATIRRAGERVVVATLKDGDFFGEIAVLSGGVRTASVTALQPTELLELQQDKLLQIFSRYPEIEAKVRLANEERGMRLSS